MKKLVAQAIEELTAAFERNGYNPTPIIDLGVLVASADGKPDERERAILLDVFQTLLDAKLNAEVVDHLVTASLEVIEAAGAEHRARLVGAILHDCDAAEPGVLVALAIAFASEGLSESEQIVIDRIAAAAELSPSRVAELTNRVRAKAVDGPVSVRNLLAAPPAKTDA